MLNNIITPSQSGFLPGESTTSQLLCIYENLCSNFDKRITTQSVYFDISKAFDRVWHRGLLLKLVYRCKRKAVEVVPKLPDRSHSGSSY